DVGDTEVARDGAGLEQQAGQHGDQAGGDGAVRRPGQRGAQEGIAGGAARSVEQGDPGEHEHAEQRADQVVLHGRLGAGSILEESGQGVAGYRGEQVAGEQQQQISGAREDDGAERGELEEHVELSLPWMGGDLAGGQAHDKQEGSQDDDADGAGGDVDDVTGPEVRSGRLRGGQGRGSQPGQAGCDGYRADHPLPVARQPGAGQQPGDRADGQDDLGGERAEVLVHRATRWVRARAAGSMRSRRNLGVIPMTTARASSGTVLAASVTVRSLNAAGVPGPPGRRSGPVKICCSARRNSAAVIKMPATAIAVATAAVARLPVKIWNSAMNPDRPGRPRLPNAATAVTAAKTGVRPARPE